MILSAENVERIFMDCLFKDGENTSNAKIVNGIMSNFGFNPKKIEKYKDEIYSMLKELPEAFHKETGGGMTFLNACNDKNGNQWTGLHCVMEQLFILGIACDKVNCLFPRDLWNILPGGMPYYVVV